MAARGGVALPSLMRVVAGVAITLGLAVGGIAALRKVLMKADGRWTSQGIKVLGKAVLGSSMRVHLLEVDASRVLIVEGRGGVGITLLPEQPQSGRRDAA